MKHKARNLSIPQSVFVSKVEDVFGVAPVDV